VISPNGKLIAFSGREPSGRISALLCGPWIRPTRGHIAGTDGASFPILGAGQQADSVFYSSARGRLERVDLAGGAPVVIASGSYVRGAS
jgi:hypothetical protein